MNYQEALETADHMAKGHPYFRTLFNNESHGNAARALVAEFWAADEHTKLDEIHAFCGKVLEASTMASAGVLFKSAAALIKNHPEMTPARMEKVVAFAGMSGLFADVVVDSYGRDFLQPLKEAKNPLATRLMTEACVDWIATRRIDDAGGMVSTHAVRSMKKMALTLNKHYQDHQKLVDKTSAYSDENLAVALEFARGDVEAALKSCEGAAHMERKRAMVQSIKEGFKGTVKTIGEGLNEMGRGIAPWNYNHMDRYR